MDSLSFEKVWNEDGLFELRVEATSKYVSAFQYCYIPETDFIEIGNKLTDYISAFNKECYLEFGKKTGNYTPAFSLLFFPADNHGHVRIEVDLEIDDNKSRSHRCNFFLDFEIGQVEHFARSINQLLYSDIGFKASIG